MEDASTLSKIPSQNAQIFGFVYHDTNGLNHGPVWKTQSFLSKGICTVILWQDSYGKGNLRNLYWNTVGKNFNWECLFVNRAKGPFLSVYVDDIKMAGRTENIKFTWKILMTDVDLEKPTSFLDRAYLGCTQRECTICNEIVTNKRNMFEARISAGAMEKLLTRASGKPDAETYLLGPTTGKVMQRNVWKDLVKLANKTTQQLYTKSQHHALTTTNSKKKKRDLLDNCLKFAHRLF